MESDLQSLCPPREPKYRHKDCEQFLFIVVRDKVRGPEEQVMASPSLPPRGPGARVENKGFNIQGNQVPQRTP